MSQRSWIIRTLCAALMCCAAASSYAATKDTELVLPKLETIVMGQSQFLAGSMGALRVVVSNHVTGLPVRRARVGVTLRQTAQPAQGKTPSLVTLLSGRTDRDGTLRASFNMPDAIEEGEYELVFNTQALGEQDNFIQRISVVRDQQILLTTDKPLYQPGQVMHIRTLTLNKPTLSAFTNEPLTIEVEDAKGNKVFKKPLKTDAFGIASVDFQLASEVNMGRYTIRAIVAKTKAEKKVTVERYVLPKFKIKFTPDKSYYLAGETVSGKLQVDYMFGKPVANSEVTIKASTFDVGFKDFAEIKGRTDDSGSFSFEQELPGYFAGQPLEQGNAFVKLEIQVKDSADHVEKTSQTLPVAAQPLKIIAVPDGGRIVSGVPNTIYIMATYPDGSPAQSEMEVTYGGQQVTGKPLVLSDRFKTRMANVAPRDGLKVRTDKTGIAALQITPNQRYLNLYIRAREEATLQWAEASFEMRGSSSEDSVLLATDKALAKVGEKVNITVLSPSSTGTVYLDVIRDGQTVNTQSIDLRNGRGGCSMTLTEDLAGTLEIHAYRISRSGLIVRDTRLLYVNPADDLAVRILPGSQSYLPGGPARVNFDVRDSRGRGIAAALGVSIVDESVFALQEMQPGMEKIYFLLEKELMEPKFELHGLTPSGIIEPIYGQAVPEAKQDAARVLFSLALQNRNTSSPYTLSKNTYAEKYAKIRPELQKRVDADALKIARAVVIYNREHTVLTIKDTKDLPKLVKVGNLKQSDLQDYWGRPYEIAAESVNWLQLICAGPDGIMHTSDDLMAICYRSNSGDAEAIPEFTVSPGSLNVWSGNIDRFAAEDDLAKPGAAFLWPEGVADAVPFDLDNSIVVKGTDEKFRRMELAGEVSASPLVSKEQVRVRQYFPETMYFNPAVITDGRGRASIDFDVADSITTWRISATASSRAGQLGSATEGLKVFQDFFIDIDLPVSLTCNDEVSIPVAVYNYLPSAQKVTLELTTEPWFELMDTASKTLEIGESDVQAVYFRIKVKDIGTHKLTVHAMGSKMSDAISREIEITPDGRQQLVSINDRLEKSVEQTINISADAIEGASNILVKVYPGIFSQVVEGMDKILQMPYGCFEQTSSTTYPNILVLDYMKTTGQAAPEIRMKAEQYINLGYQRLVTFEVQGGGFSWFGNPPANKVLTAYGLMEFADMSRVYEVDPNLIGRTQQWIISQREKDGSWKPDASYLHDESWGRIQHNALLPTAWITWALIRGGYDPKELLPSIQYLKENAAFATDAYTLAILANALVAAGKDDPQAQSVLEKLADMAVEENGKTCWKSDVSTITFSRGECANVETTGLAVLAFISSGRRSDLVSKALNYIIASKDASGTWGSTQATITSLKALLASISSQTTDVSANVKVLVNGSEAGSFRITPQDSDVLRQIDCKGLVKPGANQIRIEFEGKGSTLYQISGKYFLPWDKLVEAPEGKLVSIDVDFDRTELEKDDTITSTVKISYNRPGSADMVMVDLGTPPGFQVMTEDLEQMRNQGVIQRYSITGRQVILYFDKLQNGSPVQFRYHMKAKFPIRARTGQSRVYLYYNPEIQDVAAPTNVLVK